MAIGNLQFLQATSAQGRYTQPYGYHQASIQQQGAPTTTARIEPSYKPSIEDYEKAQAWANVNSNNFFTQGTNSTRHAAQYGVADATATSTQHGFTAVGNGNGELIADTSNREDKIEGANFKEYFA